VNTIFVIGMFIYFIIALSCYAGFKRKSYVKLSDEKLMLYGLFVTLSYDST